MDADDMMPSDAQIQAAAEGDRLIPPSRIPAATAGRLNWLRLGCWG